MTLDTNALFGHPTPRVDGAAKVTGAARYPSDEPLARPAYAYLVKSTIARGRLTGLSLDRAKAVPGVLDILTHENVGDQAKPAAGLTGGATTTTLESDRIWHAGQIVAVVVADSYEAAREAAHRVEVHCESEKPSASFDSAGAEPVQRKRAGRPDPRKGDAAAAFAGAPVKIEARYETPTQHHNAMELFTTTCVWNGPKLTIYEPTQYMYGTRATVADRLRIDPANVRTVSRYVGGAFGSKGWNPATVWIAIAAKRLGRPVKLVPTRSDGFTTMTYRAETRHLVKLGAQSDGKLTSFHHEGWELSSRASDYNVSGVETTAKMYACPNIETAVHVVQADRNTPGFMRAPAETPYMFALESAMDELSYALKMDPIELRRVNDTQLDPVSGKPFSSRSLMQCYDQAAARFGWSARAARPASMRDGDWMVGYGCATACYPTLIGPAAARLSVTPDGRATIGLAGHEIGTGAYTVVAIIVSRSLGLKIEDVTVNMGDSDLPPVVLAGGSNNAATVSHVVAKAGEMVKQRIVDAAVAASDGPFRGADPATLSLSGGQLIGPGGRSEPLSTAIGRAGGRIEVYAENVPEGLPPTAMAAVGKGGVAFIPGAVTKNALAYAFGAQLVEVRVHERTREIRVPRVVSAFAAGTIVNPTTARSQYMGGAIWGLSSALHEATEMDIGTARYINDNFADYLIPVNSDVPSIEIIMVPEQDERVNPLGIKGIGEVGIVGMNAAVANAVFHATGKRIRELPIRVEKLL